MDKKQNEISALCPVCEQETMVLGHWTPEQTMDVLQRLHPEMRQEILDGVAKMMAEKHTATVPATSDAKATLRHSITMGLSERAHLTGASGKHADIQVPDILDALFAPHTRWAVEQYILELRLKEAAERQLADD